MTDCLATPHPPTTHILLLLLHMPEESEKERDGERDGERGANAEPLVISFFEIYRVIMLIFYFIIDLSLAIPSFFLLHFSRHAPSN